VKKLVFIFSKINDIQSLEVYLWKERITYEIYQINIKKRRQNEDPLLPNKKQKSLEEGK
jgi:hypothetical protein